MASGREQEDREITLDLNHLWIPRGGPTQAGGGNKSWGVFRMVALRHGRFPAQAPALKDEEDARGARRHGRFPTQASVLKEEEDSKGGRAAMLSHSSKTR